MGRPNVGKSSLINRIVKTRRAITLDEEGITRDLVSVAAQWKGHSFELLDSGGVLFNRKNRPELQDEIEGLVLTAMHSADRVLFLVDYQHGIHDLDMGIAKQLRVIADKVTLVVNKVDDKASAAYISDFYKLGLGEPVAISATNGIGVNVLLDRTLKGLKRVKVSDKEAIRVALIGRPNMGKSSLLNALLNQDRVLVSELSGTTRDSVDVMMSTQDQDFVFVDTAGLRRKGKHAQGVEYYSNLRTQQAIEHSDVVVVLLDASVGILGQDKKIIQKALDAKKPFLIFMNKWDLLERTDQLRKDMLHMLKVEMPMLDHFPILVGSAKEKIHLGQLISTIVDVYKVGQTRIHTSELNQFIQQVIAQYPPSTRRGNRIRIYYGTQVGILPPHFVFFVNQTDGIAQDYYRFLERKLREYFNGFLGTAIEIQFNHHRSSSGSAKKKPGALEDA